MSLMMILSSNFFSPVDAVRSIPYAGRARIFKLVGAVLTCH